jgi:predicted ATPase
LRQLAGACPVVLVVEDVQWADAPSLELLRYAIRRVDGARLLVVATVQEEHRASPMRLLGDIAEHVCLRPWTSADIVELAAAYRSPQAAAEILRRTGGHPLFAVQLLQAKGTTEVPAPVTAHVVNRLRHVGSKAEELLRASASLGTVVDPGLLAGMLGIGLVAATRRCQRALACRLIRPAGPVYVFGNDLIRQVLYDSTPSPTRRIYARLHQGAVQTWTGRTAPSRPHAPFAGAVGRRRAPATT